MEIKNPQNSQNPPSNEKITPDHLRRNAYLYLRQSTMKQVLENQESTKRQYCLKDRAIALGWQPDRIIVIDSDQGHSAASTEGREGFKRLTSEVSMGHCGIVIGLEVSRLARNSTDWHRLMEICVLTNTLILDEDGIYDPRQINDRLLLGLKGAISEFELHMIHSRLWGGKLAKALRGELHCELPVGFVYTPLGEVSFSPDSQVRQTIAMFFSTFRQVGSAMRVVRHFNNNGLKFPNYVRIGVHKGETVWKALDYSRAKYVLKNPRYAGAYFYGRTRKRKFANSNGSKRNSNLDRSQWYSLIKNRHPGYISWEEYEENLRTLFDNSNKSYRGGQPGVGVGAGAVREGTALLQGLVICGICGSKMEVHYHYRNGERVPDYLCPRGKKFGKRCCQGVAGSEVDGAIGQLLMSSVTPLALEVAINVEKELRSQVEEIDRIRRQGVERARYEAAQARQRYMSVDPQYRLVAATLEAEWNDKLRELDQEQQEYERQCQKERRIFRSEGIENVKALASDFPRLWKDERISARDRKRMVRLLIQDVALKKEVKEDEYSYSISVKVRFRGGMIKTLNVPGPKRVWQKQKTSEKIVSQIDRLLNHHVQSEIADILNKSGLLSLRGRPFTAAIIYNIQRQYRLKSRYERLRENKLLTLEEISNKMQISKVAVKKLEKSNMIKSYNCTNKRKKLYQYPDNDFMEKLPEIFKRGAV